jgi:hypothetical protein
MRYTVTAESWPSRGRFPITDESGSVRFRVVRSSLRDTAGLEVAVIKRRRFRPEIDILVAGRASASVRYAGFEEGYEIVYDEVPFTATRDFATNTYTVIRPEGATVATFSKNRAFRHSFEAEILEEAHQVLLLAAMFAIQDIRKRRTPRAVAHELSTWIGEGVGP